MTTALDHWPRKYYQQAGGKPMLSYAVFGAFPAMPAIPAQEYRSHGVVRGIKLFRYDQDNARVMQDLRTGQSWDELANTRPALAQQIARAAECIILRGELEDGDTLDYLRDTIGLVTYLMDNGGSGVFDPLTGRWWAPAEWRRDVFSPAGPAPTQHVVITTVAETEKPGRAWIRTRGLRKFGRPDLSLRNIPREAADSAMELTNRFIDFLANGAILQDGKEVDLKTVKLVCRLQNNLNDPIFHNQVVEMVWPG